MAATPIAPHGGTLTSRVVDAARARELKDSARDWPSLDLTLRQRGDLELLLNGGFSPLAGFMNRTDYESVRDTMRLADGTLWPMPVVLDVDEDAAASLAPGRPVALRDEEGVILAALHVDEIWTPDPEAEAKAVFGTADPRHPGLAGRPRRYVGGKVEGLQLPVHHDYRELRHTPAELRAEFAKLGWSRVVAFQPRGPMHRAQRELTLRAAREAGAKVLIHPAVGLSPPGDAAHHTRVRCYKAVLSSYPEGDAMLSLLPLATRPRGPREAVWHAVIRKNYGCSHLLLDADPGSGVRHPVADPGPELGVTILHAAPLVYAEDRKTYVPVGEASGETRTLSDAEQRRLLAEGKDLPEWFTFPAVANILRQDHPPRRRQGFCVFFTGLSGSGKSTIANALRVKLLERGGRAVTFLDGDVVRKHLSSELGFSREHRDLNVRRIGWVAAEVVRHGGIAICCPIAPYDAVRKENRAMTAAHGGFILVHVSTPVDVCEKRDRKGLYAKARAGIIREFTGISDPYEEPTDAEITLDTSIPAEASADRIIAYLEKHGYLAD